VRTKGGPRLLGQLVADGLLDELFLTVSPVLAGRADTSRSGLVAARELLSGRAELAGLVSVRQRGSYLLPQYRLHRKEPASSGYDDGHGSQVRTGDAAGEVP
jgi:riboflavin biosynthesis pyrimidine reductase